MRHTEELRPRFYNPRMGRSISQLSVPRPRPSLPPDNSNNPNNSSINPIPKPEPISKPQPIPLIPQDNPQTLFHSAITIAYKANKQVIYIKYIILFLWLIFCGFVIANLSWDKINVVEIISKEGVNKGEAGNRQQQWKRSGNSYNKTGRRQTYTQQQQKHYEKPQVKKINNVTKPKVQQQPPNKVQNIKDEDYQRILKQLQEYNKLILQKYQQKLQRKQPQHEIEEKPKIQSNKTQQSSQQKYQEQDINNKNSSIKEEKNQKNTHEEQQIAMNQVKKTQQEQINKKQQQHQLQQKQQQQKQRQQQQQRLQQKQKQQQKLRQQQKPKKKSKLSKKQKQQQKEKQQQQQKIRKHRQQQQKLKQLHKQKINQLQQKQKLQQQRLKQQQQRKSQQRQLQNKVANRTYETFQQLLFRVKKFKSYIIYLRLFPYLKPWATTKRAIIQNQLKSMKQYKQYPAETDRRWKDLHTMLKTGGYWSSTGNILTVGTNSKVIDDEHSSFTLFIPSTITLFLPNDIAKNETIRIIGIRMRFNPKSGKQQIWKVQFLGQIEVQPEQWEIRIGSVERLFRCENKNCQKLYSLIQFQSNNRIRIKSIQMISTFDRSS